MIVGIDLGTTNSLIGMMDSGFPILVAGEDGSRLTPSVVHYPTGGSPIVGRAATPYLTSLPERTIFSAKRLIGLRASEVKESFPYQIVAGTGGQCEIDLGGQTVSPEAVASEILKKLKSDAARVAGQPVERAVITVPAYFNDAQRAATKRAGELAGFTVERILSEPTAAALAYGLDRLGERARVAVYDLGGGTFDLSILELQDGVFEVIATHGDTHFGGDDFDRITAEFLQSQGIHGVTRESARALRETLSNETYAEVAGHRVGRDELLPLWRKAIESTRRHCEQALFDARIETGDLDAVILVGGATRMPVVREFVREFFHREPDCSQHPDEAVAMGAVIQAGVLEGSVHNVTLLDVTPLSLGIETFGGLMNVIIPRNTTIPVKRGEMFTNAVANQSSMDIKILQGEREMARDNWPLGELVVPFPPAPKGQARVGVQFEIDANGILHVLARDVATGTDHTVEINSAIRVDDAAVEQMVGESVEHAFADMNERIFTEARLKAEEMIPAVETALVKLGDAVPADQREMIEKLVTSTKAAIALGSTTKLKKLTAELDDATQDLATLLLESLMQ